MDNQELCPTCGSNMENGACTTPEKHTEASTEGTIEETPATE